MRLLSTAAACVLLSASIVGQEPSPENFSRFRAQVIDRLAQSTERLGLNGLGGRPLHANVSQVFGIASEVRVIKAAEIAYRDDHNLTLTFSTNSTDIVLAETKRQSDGTLLLLTFHTDLTLVLRGVASGPDADSLHLVPTDTDSVSAFRRVLLTWDRQLPRMLESRTPK